VSKAGRQLLMTTHSVAFLDYVNIDDIVYLYRDLADGRTVAVKLSQIPEVRENLEYMYPGEVLYNMTNQQIAELCMKRSK
jgi:predicted ATP-dependent endonuclease of OLD family